MKRGGSRSSRNVGRDAVDATVSCAHEVAGRVQTRERSREARETSGIIAYGEVVWSWHPLLMLSLAEVLAAQPGTRSHSICRAMVANRNSSPGRARRKPFKPLRGECRTPQIAYPSLSESFRLRSLHPSTPCKTGISDQHPRQTVYIRIHSVTPRLTVVFSVSSRCRPADTVRPDFAGSCRHANPQERHRRYPGPQAA